MEKIDIFLFSRKIYSFILSEGLTSYSYIFFIREQAYHTENKLVNPGIQYAKTDQICLFSPILA